MNRVNDALYIVATQRGKRIEEASREAWQYQELMLVQGTGVRARVAAGLLALAVRLAPEVVRRVAVASAATA